MFIRASREDTGLFTQCYRSVMVGRGKELMVLRSAKGGKRQLFRTNRNLCQVMRIEVVFDKKREVVSSDHIHLVVAA